MCKLLFSRPIEMQKQYAEYPVAAIIEFHFVYLIRKIFASVFFEFPSPRL